MEKAATIDVDSYGSWRGIGIDRGGDAELGPLRLLPGTWKGNASGWSVTALPSVDAPPGRLDYRLLLDQFDETLTFSPPDDAVDRQVGTLDYEQVITQVAVADRPDGGGAGMPSAFVQHEPGLFLHMRDNRSGGGPTIGRLATVPYGDAALALGNVVAADGPPRFEGVDALPHGVAQSLENPYLEPYRYFHDNPFLGFDPTRPQAVLQRANQLQPVARTTVIVLDTRPDPGGTRNSPFVGRQPNATRMQSIFWINELVERDERGEPRLQLQYLQIVDLEFFPRRDGRAGRIVWPHVTVNTLDRVPATAR